MVISKTPVLPTVVHPLAGGGMSLPYNLNLLYIHHRYFVINPVETQEIRRI